MLTMSTSARTPLTSHTRGALVAIAAAIIVVVVACILLGVGANAQQAAEDAATSAAYRNVLSGGSLADSAAMMQGPGMQPATVAALVAFGIAAVLLIASAIIYALRPRPTEAV